MTTPNIGTAQVTKANSFAIALDTASEENLIGNSASSNQTMSADIWLFNSDGTNSVSVTIRDRNAVGTPIINNTNAGSGVDPTVTTGTDATAGTATIVLSSVVIPGGAGLLVKGGYRLRENHALTFQAGNASRCTVVLDVTLLGS
jgi:hypothetical protein